MRTFVTTCLVVALFAAPCAASDLKPQTSLAMHGAAKYAEGFTHFDYADPDAPKGGTLKLGASGSFDSLNPFIIRGNPALGLSTGYLSLIYEPLMARSQDEPFTLYGLLAQSVVVPEDRSSITFNLNPHAMWSDGKPVTADDVLFSFETLRDKGRPNHRTYYKKVAKAEKLSETSVKFTFKPNAQGIIDREMPLIMALMPILPKHDWEGREFNQTSLRIPIGSGPYIITKVEPGRSIIYTRNPHYWGRDLPVERGLHNFDTIRIDYYRDDGISLQAFKAGQYDWRLESNPNRWATAYDFPAVHDGRVRLEELPQRRVEPASGFIFNTRRDLFHDRALREALSYAFDSGWINRNLFHGRYHRITSFFPNSELAAPPLPDGPEKEILEKYLPICSLPLAGRVREGGENTRASVPGLETQAPSVTPPPPTPPARGGEMVALLQKCNLPSNLLTAPVTPVDTDGSEESLRANLLKATSLLRDAGYEMKDGELFTPNAKRVAFEIMLSDPAEEKIALNWARALRRLGIAARVHTVDSAQYQARLAAFDYDVTVGRWINTLSPGNEQIFFWGSAAANQQGSRNYAGVKDPVVDALAAAIPEAATRDELVATTHALDRVLMSGHYTVPFYYLGADDVASWNKLHHPAALPPYGVVVESWWAK